MVADKLEKLRESIPGCEALAFADVSTKMVLVSVPEGVHSQGVWNKHCADATKAMNVGGDAMQFSYVATKEETHVFVRAADEPNDLLICLCKPEIDLAKLVPSATTCLADIASEAS